MLQQKRHLYSTYCTAHQASRITMQHFHLVAMLFASFSSISKLGGAAATAYEVLALELVLFSSFLCKAVCYA